MEAEVEFILFINFKLLLHLSVMEEMHVPVRGTTMRPRLGFN